MKPQVGAAVGAAVLALPGARAEAVERGSGRVLLPEVFSGSFFWPTQDVPQARLTTVNDTDLQRLCELHPAWVESGDGVAPDQSFAAKFRDSFVLLPKALPCDKKWSERNAIAPLAILNASVIVFSSDINNRPAPNSPFHDGDKYGSVDFLAHLQWLATNSDVNGTATRDEILAMPEGQQFLDLDSITVDPNPWQTEFESPLRAAMFASCAALQVFNALLAIATLAYRRVLGRNKKYLPTVVLTVSAVVNLFLGTVVVGMNGFRIRAILSLSTFQLFATVFHCTTTACSFLLVLFWNQLVRKSIGGARKAGCLSDRAIVAGAVFLCAVDWLAGMALRNGLSIGFTHGIVAQLSSWFQITALFTLNRATWAALGLMKGSTNPAWSKGRKGDQISILVKRISVLVRIATVSGVISGVGSFLYAGTMHKKDTPSELLNWDFGIAFADTVNRLTHILVFWPVRESKGRSSKVTGGIMPSATSALSKPQTSGASST